MTQTFAQIPNLRLDLTQLMLSRIVEQNTSCNSGAVLPNQIEIWFRNVMIMETQNSIRTTNRGRESFSTLRHSIIEF